MGASQSQPVRRRERTGASANAGTNADAGAGASASASASASSSTSASTSTSSRNRPTLSASSVPSAREHYQEPMGSSSNSFSNAQNPPLDSGHAERDDTLSSRRRRPLSLQVPPSSFASHNDEPTSRRAHLARRISSLIRRSGSEYDDASTSKRERSASSSVHQPSPGRPVQKRRRVGATGQVEDLEELDTTSERNGLDLDLAPSSASPRGLTSGTPSLFASGRSTPLSAVGTASSGGPPRLNSNPNQDRPHSFYPYPHAEYSPHSPAASPPGASTPLPINVGPSPNDPAPESEQATSPTEELLADRLRSISTIRDALGSEWTPSSSSASITPSTASGLFSRFRRISQRDRQSDQANRERDRHLRPPTPSLSSGSTAATTSTASTPARERESRSLSHRLSAIMGFAAPSRSEEWEEQPPSRTASSTTFGPGSASAAPITPEDAPASSGDPNRIPVGAVLVIQGLAQTHANLEDGVDQAGIMPGSRRRRVSESAIGATRNGLAAAAGTAPPPPRPRIDVASLDQQARMIGNLLTVAAAATATTLLSPASLAPQQSRTTAHSAMQTLLERFRPQRSRADQSIESTLGEYLRTVLRDNRRFAEAVAGDATSGNIPSEFQDFLQTLQQDLILAVRAYAVPEDEDDESESTAESSATDGAAADADPLPFSRGSTPAPSAIDPTLPATSPPILSPPSDAPTLNPPSDAPTINPAPDAPIPTFHNQRGQNLPGTAARLGVSGGADGVPRRLNFFRAHLFPSVSNGGERATDDDANAMVPSIFVGVRSVTHDPNMTTQDLVGHPGFPFLDGQVPDESTGFSDDEPVLDGEERELYSTPPTTSSSLPSSLGPPPSNSPRRSFRDRVRDRLTPRRENRSHAPLNTYLIYVIGGNYPRSHPVLAIPSLVSGGPLTAEDLALVSELLGPAKPPTASADEINRSGLAVVSGKDLDQLHTRGEVLEASLERCMVCLSDYEPEEECRVLKCRHAFHKECVDHWLSQGRNSCPACRTEAVDKSTLPDATGEAEPEPVGTM